MEESALAYVDNIEDRRALEKCSLRSKHGTSGFNSIFGVYTRSAVAYCNSVVGQAYDRISTYADVYDLHPRKQQCIEENETEGPANILHISNIIDADELMAQVALREAEMDESLSKLNLKAGVDAEADLSQPGPFLERLVSCSGTPLVSIFDSRENDTSNNSDNDISVIERVNSQVNEISGSMNVKSMDNECCDSAISILDMSNNINESGKDEVDKVTADPEEESGKECGEEFGDRFDINRIPGWFVMTSRLEYIRERLTDESRVECTAIELSIPTVETVTGSNGRYTSYIVKICFDSKVWEIRRSYCDFYYVHCKLKAIFDNDIPFFPKRRHGTSALSGPFVEERRRGLEKYIRKVSALVSTWNSLEFILFLNNHENMLLSGMLKCIGNNNSLNCSRVTNESDIADVDGSESTYNIGSDSENDFDTNDHRQSRYVLQKGSEESGEEDSEEEDLSVHMFKTRFGNA